MNKLQHIAVIGAGVMGVGVAQCAAEAGFKVTLVDTSWEVLDKAKTTIANNVRFAGLMKGIKSVANSADIIEKISFTTTYEQLCDADLVVENVTENWQAKQEVYGHLEQHCPPQCVYAVNTSAISITKVGGITKRAANVIGMHFMNPVPLKGTVEVIKGFHTSEATIATADAFLSAMQKEMVLVNDSPGFVSNRVLMLTVNEAVNLVHEGVATAEQVDKIFTSCFSHQMGPLETADLIGLDTILYSIEMLYEQFSDSKYRPSTLLKKMVDAGLLGKKSGEGFFKYSSLE
ncbi:3-hydroxyacyl-CoA dehydrogenase family protein [Pseudoalteromonas sp. OOF1S-7]|uniref:3-hydroxyacyl-CoA dehydrogenase family protein n=1 Tax=Pseudoalteromonas sp. OOF1S-7 TaxID=2917757 RepID=UPI001EF6D2C6|nr:3-hydroxyacyl-CoA dehydrogenase family protein [Pseudoalteromonas sp. OOF1S-7]MCG7534492.1 3-hydroxyacyl-CoA dehydrogenase family protein [Pseudoalteromonas sp. OOF1S-7]